MNTEEAKDRMEIALLGLKVSDVFQKQLSEFLSTMQTTRSVLQMASTKVSVLEKINIKGKDLSNEEIAIKESVNEGIYKDADNAAQILGKFDFFLTYSILKVKIKLFGKDAKSKDEVSIINEKCKSLLDDNVRLLIDLLDLWKNEIKNNETKEFYASWTGKISEIVSKVDESTKITNKIETFITRF